MGGVARDAAGGEGCGMSASAIVLFSLISGISAFLLFFAGCGLWWLWRIRRAARHALMWEQEVRAAELERRVWEAAVYRAGQDPEDVGR